MGAARVCNTPFIVSLFSIFFGPPSLARTLSPEVASITAMVVNLWGRMRPRSCVPASRAHRTTQKVVKNHA